MVIRVLRTVTVPLLLAAMLALAGLVADQVYSGQLLTVLVAGAALGSALVSLACTRLPAWPVAPLSLLGLAGYLGFTLDLVAVRAGIDDPLPSVAEDALVNGIPRMLAALVPVEPQPDTVALPVVATWVAGLAAAELAGRARRTLVALVPPVLMFAAALWLVGPGRPVAWWPTLGFAGLAVAALAVTGRVRTPEGGIDAATRAALRLRSAVAGSVGLLLVVAVTLVAAPRVAALVAADQFDPRSLVDPPQADALDENPLIRLSGWALEPDRRLLTATVDADSRIRLAVLSDYDGVTWRVGATYRPAGRVLPGMPATRLPEGAGETATVNQEIVIDGLTGKLLPAVADPRRVDGIRVAYDTGTGTLIRPEGLTEGTAYQVSSRRAEVDVNLLPGADVPTGPDQARYLALGPGVPQSMVKLAETLGADNGAPYQRALAIEQFLAEHYRLDRQAPSGHAYPNLEFFLFTSARLGGARGTSEQFAASFAVLARLLNLPCRIVVGFSAEAGRNELSAGDAYAWPEVYFTGLGWTAFHPLPQGDAEPQPLEDEFRPKPQQSTPPAAPAPVPTEEPTLAVPTASGSGEPVMAQGSDVVLVAGVSGTLLLAVAAFVVFVLVARSRLRRRRLELGSPADRVGGAWLEVADALRLAGRPAPGHLTAAEVAAHAADAAMQTPGKPLVRLAAPAIGPLADSVNAAAFARDGVGEAEAEQAKAQAQAYVAELKARRSWWRRLIWDLHPGPLRWNRRR